MAVSSTLNYNAVLQGDKKKSQGKGRRNVVEDNQNENLSQCNGKFVSKDRGDISASPSKYEQKKAKKQAKKQAKVKGLHL